MIIDPKVVTPAERILNLAAYLKEKLPSGVSIDDITANVKGYDPEQSRDQKGRLIGEGPEWEALRRKVRRDLEDLTTEWGIESEYDESNRLYRLRPPFFNLEERRELIAAASTIRIDGIDGVAGQIGTGVNDLEAGTVVQVHPLVATLRDAMVDHQKVEFLYEETLRTLEPWALGKWRNSWYVAGWEPKNEAFRRYRLDRISGTISRVGPVEAFVVQDWFDSELAFDLDPNSWGHDPLLIARVEVDQDFGPSFISEFQGEVTSKSDEIWEVEFKVRHYQSTLVRLLAFREHARIVSPPPLQSLVQDHLFAVIEKTT